MADDGLRPGELLAGRYRLIDRIGAGGMAVIWRAHDETLDRLVAVKVLDLAWASMRDLVRREAWAAARLSHPDVASVHDFVLVGETGVLVMQLVEGEPLADRIALGPLPWREAVRIGLRIARVLALAHSRGVIHRDITPDNVIVNGDHVTVLDFGIAATVGEPDEDSTGASFGTPAYVAPERLDGTPAQTATDVYALGVVLFEMLTGKVPFRVSGWDDVAADHGPPPVPRIAGAPGLLGPLVVRMLARDPAHRPPATDVVAALERTTRGLPPKRPLAALVGASAVVAAVLAVWWPLRATNVSETEPPPPPAVPSAAPSSRVPGVAPSTPASVPGPSSTAPSQTLSQTLSVSAARQTALAVLKEGEAAGKIRKDAAVDLRNVITNAATVSHVDSAKGKVADREREGTLDPALADRLRSALDNLANALSQA